MTNEELIKELSKLPKDSRILAFYDSASRLSIDKVYLNEQGVTILLDEDDFSGYDYEGAEPLSERAKTHD